MSIRSTVSGGKDLAKSTSGGLGPAGAARTGRQITDYKPLPLDEADDGMQQLGLELGIGSFGGLKRPARGFVESDHDGVV